MMGVVDDDFVRFCVEMHPRLVRGLSLYCGNGDVAEELAQDALAIAFRDWRKVRELNDPEGWTFRVGFNAAHSLFRRKAAERRALARRAAKRHATTDPAEAIALRHAVAALPRRQKAALILRFLEDRSVAETARLMDCPEATVKTLTRQGLTALRLQDDVHALREVGDVY